MSQGCFIDCMKANPELDNVGYFSLANSNSDSFFVELS